MERFSKIKNYIINSDFKTAIVIALSIILLGVFFGWYNNKVVPINATASARYTLEPGNPLSFLSNWDGPNYLNIAKNGYSYNETNFLPLYPILIHAVNLIIPSELDSAIIISWLSLLVLIYFYLKIIKVLFEDTAVDRLKAVWFLLLFPTAIFFLATYTESLFALLAFGAIYFVLTKKYYYSAIFAMFMSATHITAIFVLLLLGLLMWENKATIKQIIINGMIGLLGLLAYMFYLEETFHKPLAFILTQKNHGWLSEHYGNIFTSIDIFNVIFIILIISASVYWWHKKRSFSLYALSFLLIPLVGQQFGGFNRYVLMIFPIPLMFYRLSKNRPNLALIYIAISSVAWTYFLLQYAGGYVGG